MDGHFMAFKIELLGELILIVVCLGEEGHFGSAVEVVSSLFDMHITTKYSSRASHLHHMTECRGSLRIIPGDCHKLRDFRSVLDRRMSRLSTLAVRQFTGRRAGVGTTQATVQRAGLAVFSRIASPVSTVIPVNGDVGFYNGGYTRRSVCRL